MEPSLTMQGRGGARAGGTHGGGTQGRGPWFWNMRAFAGEAQSSGFRASGAQGGVAQGDGWGS